MKLFIVTSKSFSDLKALNEELQKLLEKHNIDEIGGIGAQQGGNALVAQAAKKLKVEYVTHYPNWREHGNGAGFRRNMEVVDAYDAGLVFLDKGMKDVARHFASNMRRIGKPLRIITFTPPRASLDGFDEPNQVADILR